jgi:hypothetical protein
VNIVWKEAADIAILNQKRLAVYRPDLEDHESAGMLKVEVAV